jgi:hypothetical protein
MNVKDGNANFEGLGPGTMVVDMTLKDGSKWKGRFFIAPAIPIGLSGPVFNGDFPDVTRLGSSSLVGLGSVLAAIGPDGGVFVDFSDTEGQIGHFDLSGGFGSEVVDASGGGTWARIG